jgi:hypothetical protein
MAEHVSNPQAATEEAHQPLDSVRLTRILSSAASFGDRQLGLQILEQQRQVFEEQVRNVRLRGLGRAPSAEERQTIEAGAAATSHAWLETQTTDFDARIQRQSRARKIRDARVRRTSGGTNSARQREIPHPAPGNGRTGGTGDSGTNGNASNTGARDQSASDDGASTRPFDERSRISIVKTRAAILSIAEAIATISGAEASLRPDDTRVPRVDRQDTLETISLSSGKIVVETTVDSERARQETPWGIVTRLWTPRAGFVSIDVEDTFDRTSPELGLTKAAMFRRLTGVTGAVVRGKTNAARAFVEDWLREAGIRILTAEEFNSLPEHADDCHTLAYIRGGEFYLDALSVKLDRAYRARQITAADLDFAEGAHQARRPPELDACLDAIEKRCAAELRAFLVTHRKELNKKIDVLSAKLESRVEAEQNVLAPKIDPKTRETTDVRRSGQRVASGCELTEIDPALVGAVIALASGPDSTNDQDPRNRPADDLPAICADLSQKVIDFWNKRLREQILWPMLLSTKLGDDQNAALRTHIENEEFFAPVSELTTQGILKDTVGALSTDVNALLLEFEIPRKVRVIDSVKRFLEAWKIILNRFSGVFAMAMFAGISVATLTRGFFTANRWYLPLFAGALAAVQYVFLRSARAQALAIAERKAKDSLIKLQRQTLTEFASEWFKAFETNASASLIDLIRRLRSDLELPAANKRRDWERAGAEHREAKEAERRVTQQILDLRTRIGDLRKELRKRAEGHAKWLKPGASANRKPSPAAAAE